jgi:coenzyme F420-reducing hydrogenase alpha subunit
MRPEGRLMIDICPGGENRTLATISSSRPLGLTRTFQGQRPEEVVQMLPLLFSVCGMAQGVAAAEAVERALDVEVAAPTRVARQLLVLAETAREHLICAVRDWSRASGLTPDGAAILRIMQVSERVRTAIDPQRSAKSIGAVPCLDREKIAAAIEALAETIERVVLGEPIADFLSRATAADFRKWHQTKTTPAQALIEMISVRGWEKLGNAKTRHLPWTCGVRLSSVLLGDNSRNFIATPTWEGEPAETTVLSRQLGQAVVGEHARLFGTGLLTRLIARIVEIARLPAGMRKIVASEQPDGGWPIASSKLGDNEGIAEVDAARGRLVHAVSIEAGIVRRYAILAPTEWNFHPAGTAARGLQQIEDVGADVLVLANLFISALDPCVGFEVRVH